MTTQKYDLHTIDYSVQGWDAILAADMEMLDAIIPTRMIGTLGETAAAYEALYLNPDGKWYKAQADGTKQPAHGLACEGGNLNDNIRLHRMGEITNAGWSWAIIGGPVYLSPSTPGALTQVRPADNIQIIGYALTATKIIVLPPVGSPTVRGSSGGLKRKIAEATGTPAGTTTFFDIGVDVPAAAKLLGCQLRVDTALTAGETWGAAYITGSTTTIAAAGQAVAKNTKVNKMHIDEITSAITKVRITRDAGNFTNAVGVIRAIVYYEEFTVMESVP